MSYTAHQLAQIHAEMEQGNTPAALARIEAAVLEDGTNPSVWHLAGVIRRRAGKHAEAVAAFDRAQELGIQSAELLNSRALSLQDLGRLDEASDGFAAAIGLDPAYVPARVNAAKVKALQGQGEQAERDLKAALAAFPQSTLASNTLAEMIAERGEPEAALAQYRATLAIDPGNLLAAVKGGQCLRLQGRSGDALEHFRALQPRFASSPEFAEAMSGALVDCGDVAAAEALLEQLATQVPGYFPAHDAIARLAREYGTGKDGYRSYRKLAAQWPSEPSIWHRWLSLLLSYRDHDEALAVVSQAERHLGADGSLAFYKAVALSETGATPEAEEWFARVDPAAAGENACLVARARNAIRRGEAAQAEHLLARATAQDPADQFAWAYLGLAWRLLGDERELWLHDYEVQAQQRPLDYLSDAGEMEQLRETLRALHRAQSHPPEQSLRGGTQTEGALFALRDPVLQRLRDAIKQQVEAYAAALPDDETHPYYRRKRAGVKFTGSWSVRLRGEGFHVIHLHQQGWISSALHLVVPPPVIGDVPDAACLTLGQPPAELGLDLPARRIVRPVEGALVLFPSSMWHGTIAFKGGNERLTVAFDAIPA